MTTTSLPEIWETLSHKVLSCVLIDPGAVFPVLEIIGERRDWFPGKDRPIFDAILQCVQNNTPPMVEAVRVRVNGHGGYVQAIANLFNEDDNRLLIYNTMQLRDIGILAKVRALGRELSSLDKIEGIGEVVSKQADELAGLVAEKSSREPTAKAVALTAWEMVDKQAQGGIVIPSGLSWYDTEAGGFWPGENYWIAGPYKSGKTSLMRNCILHAARLGYPVGVMCAEGKRESFALDCIAMLATEILASSGIHSSQIRLARKKILSHYYHNGYFTKAELDAINEARQIFETLPIHTWDMKDDIDDTAMLKYLVRRARLNYGVKIFWADHSQLWGRRGTTYERQAEISRTVQKVAAGEDVVICMLSQQNEEGVQSGNATYSPKIKGGGDAPAAADSLFLTSFDDESHILTVVHKLDRAGEKGGKHQHYLTPSGLIMDKWITIKTTEMI